MVESEILKEKSKRIIKSDNKPKISFLSVIVSHNGYIMSESVPTSFKRFKEKFGEQKFEDAKDQLIDEGIIFTSSYGGFQLAVKKDEHYNHEKGEELSKFIGKLIFDHTPEMKKTIERIFREVEGKEFLRYISEKNGISTRDGEEPEIKEMIGKRSYEKILADLLKVDVLIEYAWSSRKHYYHGYKLLPSTDIYLKEKLSPLDFSIVKREMREKGLTDVEIYRCFNVLRKIYIGQNIRDEGILQSDFSNYNKEIELLTKFGFIKDNKWFFNLFLTTENGSKIAKLIVENIIKDKQDQIVSATLGLPHNFIGFLLFDCMTESLTYPVGKELPYDWREPILADSRIWILRTKLLSKLEELGLCVKTRSYVSTRGGELRAEYYVTSEEVLDFLKNCTAYKGGLSGKEKKACLLYNFFINAKRFLQIAGIDEVRERYYNKMDELGLTEEEIEEVVTGMAGNGITSKYKGLLSNELPFSIRDRSRYDIYLKEHLIRPVVHFLLEKPKKRMDTKAEEVAEERLEEVRRMERERIRALGLISRDERLQLYDEVGTFELEFRQFIKDELTKEFDDLWLEKGVSVAVRKKWTQRRKQEVKEGLEPETEIINYADFSDYKKVIIDNWDKIFMRCFQDKKKLVVRLDDLNIVGRRPVMHVRKVDKEKTAVARHAINWIRSKTRSFETK